ncbi:MAG: type 4a pilus biogenesis protein PilO [bacterium]|nr:type 4a pilus biogenesis protein PilO [bacterium]
MRQFFVPLILTLAAIGLFALYTNPTYKDGETGIGALSAKSASYDDAFEKSSELRAMRDKLLAQRSTFATSDIGKLQHVLPDNVDNIRLIIDINNIAARHSLSLTNVALGDVSQSQSVASIAAVGQSSSPVGSVTVGFSLVANYDDYLAFLQDLEHSLRIVDIEKMSFTVATANLNTYTFTVRTYWLH